MQPCRVAKKLPYYRVETLPSRDCNCYPNKAYLQLHLIRRATLDVEQQRTRNDPPECDGTKQGTHGSRPSSLVYTADRTSGCGRLSTVNSRPKVTHLSPLPPAACTLLDSLQR